VSVGSKGAEGNGDSIRPSISADGRFVAFASRATNLVPGDTTDGYDVFVRDREKRTTRRISIRTDGAEADGGSTEPSISSDGRFVTFRSSAPNLVGGDTNDVWDVFVRDRKEARTRRVSVNSSEVQGNGDSFVPSISGDGRFVAFRSSATNLVARDTDASADVFVRDLEAGRTTLASVNSDSLKGNGSSVDPRMSRDGRFVVFRSDASNLAYGDTNGFADIFLHDRQTGTTRRISLNTAGTLQANDESIQPVISADGRFVGFSTWATDLVEGDTNGWLDVLVRGPMR
jgi:Tol biopolymer transport system component